METAGTGVHDPRQPIFRDGLGARYRVDGTDGPCDILVLRDTFASIPSCEFLIRERVNRLAHVRSEQFARVFDVEHGGEGPKIALISQSVPGVRLSRLLTVAEQNLLPLDVDSALCLVQQIVTAMAELHEDAPDACHGSLAAERVVVTSAGRAVIVEHVLGAALAQLRYSPDRYWKDLRIALPIAVTAPMLDRRADVAAVGMIALGLLLGRPVGDEEYPRDITVLVNGSFGLGGGFERFPDWLREWLSQALSVEPTRWFASAVEARDAFKLGLKAGGHSASREKLEAFLREYARFDQVEATHPSPVPAAPQFSIPQTPKGSPFAPAPMPAAATMAHAGTQASSRVMAATSGTATTPTPIAVTNPTPIAVSTPATVATTTSAPTSRTTPTASGGTTPAPTVTGSARVAGFVPATVVTGSSTPTPAATTSAPPPAKHPAPAVFSGRSAFSSKTHDEEPEASEADEPQRSLLATLNSHSRMIAAAVVVLAVTSGGVMAARRYLATPVETAPSNGTVVVNTDPAGAAVVIDGEAHGTTPATAKLAVGPHTIELSKDGVRRSMTVNVTANSQISQFVEMPKAAVATGDLQVRSDPSGAKVSVDGQVRGMSPVTVPGLAAGNHTVVLENDLGSVREDVTVQPGATASLVVPMKAPQGATLSGWVSISAPAELQIYENQRLLGSSKTDRIMVAAGRHDFEVANDALGYRSTQTVQVAPGQVARIKPDWPQGTIAVNATPWATVSIDGQDVGETPVGNTSVPVGVHEVIFRHPQFGEQRITATVTATAPARLSVDMRKK